MRRQRVSCGTSVPGEGIASLFDRTKQNAGRNGLASRGAAPKKPIHIEELDVDPHNPFGEEPAANRWLLTTCVAGIAGSLVVGSALLGLFGNGGAGEQALAAVDPQKIWQRTQAVLKGDYNGETVTPAITTPYAPLGSNGFEGEVITASVDVVPPSGLYPGIKADTLPYASPDQPMVLPGAIRVVSADTENITTIAKTPPPEPIDQSVVLAKNEKLTDRLIAMGVTVEAAKALVGAIQPVYPQELLKADQVFEVTIDKQQDFYGNEVIYPVRLSFSPGPSEQIVVESDEDGQFIAHIAGQEEGARSRYAEANDYRSRAKIGSSLYTTAKDQGIPDYIITEMMRVYAYDVDFQRQVRAGDEFEVFYGNPITGSSRNRKVLLYASLDYSGGNKTFYRFTTPDDGRTDYYDATGASATKFLARTPVSGARLTSGFGMRMHPLLGYSKMHTGVDFGLPTGTPIKAAGNGVIEVAGRSGAYGNMVKIKHLNGYETLYAHMSQVADGIEVGGKVKQGQVIGYVGQTGRATGPHLHYEVRIAGKPVNPMKVRAAGGRQLEGKILASFLEHKDRILTMMKTAPESTRLAQNQ